MRRPPEPSRWELGSSLSSELARLRRFRREGKLPFVDDASLEEALLPLAARLRPRIQAQRERPRIIALVGAPGSGKTTLARYLCELLPRVAQLSMVQLSLDDLYLPRAAREDLARTVHPLFRQRGAPGTHDVRRGLRVLASLRGAQARTETLLPRFDKGEDDGVPEAECPRFIGRPDVIFLDSWLWDVDPPSEDSLRAPRNEREGREDPDGTWRRAAARALSQDYPELFAQADEWVLLDSPSFEATVRFRERQERDRGPRTALTGRAAIVSFLQLFERWLSLPQRSAPSERLVLDEEHRMRLAKSTPPEQG